MSGIRLTNEQRLDWLRLIRSEGIGPRTFRALVNRFGGAGAALDALPELARRAGRYGHGIASRSDALREMEAAGRHGARFVASGEPDYPRALGATDAAPPLIAVRGDAALLRRPSVAIVGSRNASALGGSFAERIAAELGAAGYVVVSGLARGIDARAHRAALRSGTVAVLAGGHDRVYPDANRPLLERIVAEGGAAVSEMPFGWEPRGRDFPRRNRIVSGLCYGVVVVEAARRSGSLITARFALEQGREVFAVPGSPLDPRAEGTNDLIRSGATLCGQVEHVTAVLDPLLDREPAREGLAEGGRRPELFPFDALWDDLGPDLAGPGADPELPAAADEGEERAEHRSETARLLALLTGAPVTIDDLARSAEMPVRQVQALLLGLELSGQVERHGGGTVSLLPSPRPRSVP